jgi:hypothetical protein
VMPGPGNPAASETVAGLTGVAVLEIEVAAGPVEAVTLTALAVQGDGTGDEAAGIGGAFLYLDANANHAFESGLDMLLAGPQTFAADDGKVTFAVSRPIPANGSEFYFVVYSFGAAAPGSTFRANFASNADASGAGALSGKAVSVSGAPVQGGTFTVAEQVSPSDVRRGGSCGGGTSPAGPGAAPGLALLALACAAARAAARKRRATPEA